MKSAEQIEHKGTIAFIERDVVRVKITVSEACGGCSARKSCAMGSREHREITIHTTEGYNYKVGDVVEVVVLEVDEKRHRISLSMKQAK